MFVQTIGLCNSGENESLNVMEEEIAHLVNNPDHKKVALIVQKVNKFIINYSLIIFIFSIMVNVPVYREELNPA